ncbi:hypothetical protein TNCV_4549271 [Trichonephila clavipes]|nr:hypothetical protein TNCV_4549271 [Trichonephila clavipes]
MEGIREYEKQENSVECLDEGWVDCSRIRATSNVFQDREKKKNSSRQLHASLTQFSSGKSIFKLTLPVPSRQGGTLNSRRAESPLVRSVDANERWKTLPPGCFTSKLGWKRAKSYCHLYGAQGYSQRQA